jgi:hypothetical protein
MDSRWDSRESEVPHFRSIMQRSVTDWATLYPEYVKNPYANADDKFTFAENLLRHKWLSVSVDQFNVFAWSLRGFWEEFPERLFQASKAAPT